MINNIAPTNTGTPYTPHDSSAPKPPPPVTPSRNKKVVSVSTNTPATPGTPTPPDLVLLNASSSMASPYPEARHQKKSQAKDHSEATTKKKPIAQQPKQDARSQISDSFDDQDDIASPRKSSDQELKEVNAKIRRKTRALKRSQKIEGHEKHAKNLRKELKELNIEREKLQRKIAENTRQSDSVSSNEKSDDAQSVHRVDTNDPSNAIENIRKMLGKHRQEMEALSKSIKGLINSPNNQNKISERMTEIGNIQNDINALEALLKHNGAGIAPQAMVKPGQNLTLLELIQTNPKFHPAPDNISQKPTLENKGKAQFTESSEVVSAPNREESDNSSSVLESVHENARHSTLIMPDDLKRRFSPQARNTVNKIDLRIMQAADEGDEMTRNVFKIKTELSRMRKNGRSTDSEIREEEVKLAKFENKQLQCYIKVGKLTEARDKLEEKELPEIPRPTHKEKDDAYKVLLESVKSVQTRGLEKIHADILAELDRTTNSSPVSKYTLLAGASAFSVSFLIINTLSRFVPAPLIAISWVGAPILAGTLHVITATPVAKQVMTRVWTSNAMGELNNHFKLRGSALRDWWCGESNEPKYASKDPTKTGKISITERLKEEKPFSSLLRDRYMTEEIGYYSYTMNYTFKAIAATGISDLLASGTWGSKGVEAAMHGLLGSFSGAEYLLAQQEQRSKHPNAKQSAVPTRECYAAEATALQSLRDDLQAKISEHRNHLNKDPKDKTESNLNKALRKTDKALIAATLRSGVLGTLRYEWWAQFSPEAIRDTVSEILGRIVSLVPTTLVSEFTRSWRASPDPLLMFLGHALPAVVLIAPPGFTARPIYSGVIRALLKAFEADTVKKTVVTLAQDLKYLGEDDSEVSAPSSSTSQRSSEESALESVIVSKPDDSDDSDDSDEGKWDGNPTKRDMHQGM